MSLERLAIQTELLTRLGGDEALANRGVSVFAHLATPIEPSDLPAVGVYYASESVSEISTSPYQVRRDVVFDLQCTVQGTVIEELDLLCDEVEQAIFDAKYASDAMLTLNSVEFQREGDAAQTYHTALIKVTASYLSDLPRAKEVELANYERFNARFLQGSESTESTHEVQQ